jgi:hypothetical protein
VNDETTGRKTMKTMTTQERKAEYRRLGAEIKRLQAETPNARDFNSWDEAREARAAHAATVAAVAAQQDEVVAAQRASR